MGIPNVQGNVSSVRCKEKTLPGLWSATCESVPGGYSQLPGSCRENATVLPYWGCDGCAESWDHIREAVPLALLALRLLTASLVAFICCAFFVCNLCRKRLIGRIKRSRVGARELQFTATGNAASDHGSVAGIARERMS